MTERTSVPLPENTVHFDHQVAGHVHGDKKTKLGLLKHKDGSVLKPVIEGDERTLRELEFYERVFHSKEPQLRALRDFLPVYRGTWSTVVDGENVQYIKLEDVTATFRRPSVLDVKIGAQTYDAFASSDKVALEEGKYPWSRKLGFRILGMRVYDCAHDQYTLFDKKFGLRQTPDTVADAFRTFLHKDTTRFAILLSEILVRLREVESWFESQQIFAFYSSSILVVYEGSDAGLAANSEPQCVIKMIDFAHAYEADQQDENYLFGLRNFIAVLEQIL